MFLELGKLYLIKLKTLLQYRALLFFTVLHVIVICITLDNQSVDYASNEGYIKDIVYNDSNDYYKYYVDDIIIYTQDKYRIGTYIIYEGECSNFEQRNFVNFDYNKFLMSEGITCSLLNPQITTTTKSSTYYRVKYNLVQIVGETDFYGLKQAIVFGNKNDLVNHELFYNLNISHLLALSGMHIALLVFYTRTIVKLFVKTKEYIVICEVVVITIYSLLICLSYSIIRSLFIYYFLLLLRLFNIRLTKLTIFLICANILVINNNYVIFSYSFIYSFFSFFIIILAVEEKLNFLKLYLILQVFLLPVTINLSNSINIIGLICAPFITVLFEFILFPYILITTIISVNDTASIYFYKLLELFYNQKFDLIIKDLSLLFMFLYYMLLFYIFKVRQNVKIIYVALSVIIMISNVLVFDKRIKIVFFDVGQGDAILIMLDNNTNILIDGGGVLDDEKKSANIAKYTIIPFLKSQGISRLDYIIASHGDIDHIGSLIYLKDNFDYGKLYINCNEINDMELMFGGEKLYNLNLKGNNFNINFSCVSREDENESSIVTHAKFYDYSFLSMGDMSSKYELDHAVRVDILKVSHHGSSTSTSSEVVTKIAPKYAIISVGENSYGHPTKEVINNLASSMIYRTDLDCAIIVEIKQNLNFTTKC